MSSSCCRAAVWSCSLDPLCTAAQTLASWPLPSWSLEACSVPTRVTCGQHSMLVYGQQCASHHQCCLVKRAGMMQVYSAVSSDQMSFCPQVTARAKDSFAATTMPAHTEDIIASARVLAESPRGSNGVQTAVLVDSQGRAAGEVNAHALFDSS